MTNRSPSRCPSGEDATYRCEARNIDPKDDLRSRAGVVGLKSLIVTCHSQVTFLAKRHLVYSLLRRRRSLGSREWSLWH